jgi:two-component system sensor histidine kinase UhpB
VVREKFRGIMALSEEAIGAVQRIASDLRPRMLDDLGLAPALDWLGTDFTRRTGIVCTVRADFPSELVGGNAATALYRIVQEALANVDRHSHADHVSIRLFVSDGVLHLMVEDDGLGISGEHATAPDSYGLLGMRERVEALGGSLSISGEPGFGTILVIRIPLPGEGALK